MLWVKGGFVLVPGKTGGFSWGKVGVRRLAFCPFRLSFCHCRHRRRQHHRHLHCFSALRIGRHVRPSGLCQPIGHASLQIGCLPQPSGIWPRPQYTRPRQHLLRTAPRIRARRCQRHRRQCSSYSFRCLYSGLCSSSHWTGSTPPNDVPPEAIPRHHFRLGLQDGDDIVFPPLPHASVCRFVFP